MTRLFPTPGADAAYDRWQEPPDIHENDDCEACHAQHVQKGDVAHNALEWPAQFPCCVDAFEEMKRERLICAKHPFSYFDVVVQICEECEAQDAQTEA